MNIDNMVPIHGIRYVTLKENQVERHSFIKGEFMFQYILYMYGGQLMVIVSYVPGQHIPCKMMVVPFMMNVAPQTV